MLRLPNGIDEDDIAVAMEVTRKWAAQERIGVRGELEIMKTCVVR